MQLGAVEGKSWVLSLPAQGSELQVVLRQRKKQSVFITNKVDFFSLIILLN